MLLWSGRGEWLIVALFVFVLFVLPVVTWWIARRCGREWRVRHRSRGAVEMTGNEGEPWQA
ncbi:MAG: hypothetical protein KDC38_15965 [Planctomycetes bacterium]|nr:hypothetical protein [Planctomycetota bacterium]